MRMSTIVGAVLACGCLAGMVAAQDAVKTDPHHYSVVTENDRVRVLKIHYGPHEKSIMHSHPDAVAIFLTDSTMQFTYPDGKKDSHTVKAGDAQFTPAGVHLPENTADTPTDVILVELKGKSAKAMGNMNMK